MFAWLPRPNTLRFKLVLIFLIIALLPLVLLVVWNDVTTRSSLTSAARRALSNAASQTATCLDDFVITNLGQVNTEADFPVLAQYLKQPLDSTQKEVEALFHSLSQTDHSYSSCSSQFRYIRAYWLLNGQGKVVYDSANAVVGQDKSGQEFFQKAIQNQDAIVLSNPSGGSSTDGFYFAARVQAETGSQPLGVLVINYDPAVLQAGLIEPRSGMAGPGSYVVVYDQSNRILASGGSPETRNQVNPAVAQSDPELQVESAPMSSIPWMVAFAQPRAAFLSSIQSQTNNSILVAVLIALLMVFIAWFSAFWVVEPINRLRTTAEKVAAGDLSVQAEVEPYEELADLSNTFNTMTARLRANLSGLEHRVDQFTLLQQIGMRLGARLNSNEVVQAVLAGVQMLVGAKDVRMFRYDDQTGRLSEMAVQSEEPYRSLLNQPPRQVGITIQVARSGKPMVVNDPAHHPLYAEKIKTWKLSSIASIPLVWAGHTLAVLNVAFVNEQHYFTDEEVSLLCVLAEQAALALENSRLYQGSLETLEDLQRTRDQLARMNQGLEQNVFQRTAELARRLEQLDLINHVGRYVTILREQETLLPTITDLIRGAFNYYAALIYLIEKPENDLRLSAISAAEAAEKLSTGIRLPIGKGIPGYVASTGQPFVVNNVASEPLYQPDENLRQTRSELALPLVIGEQTIGVLDLRSAQINAFLREDVPVLGILADQISIAIHNHGLFKAAQDAQAEAEEANRIKSQFLANMSHELRTPLNSIINFAYLLSIGTEGVLTESQEDLINRIGDAGRHLLGLINDFLDLAKIEAGRLELYFEEVNMIELIYGVLSTAAGLVHGRPIQLIRDIPEDLPCVRADHTRIRQVLLNLLSNAAKFTESGHILVRAWADEAWVTISVEDTGIGMEPENIPLAFSEFVQLDSGLSRQAGGTGLGLAISKRFVEMHGGKIWAESQPGNGSTFYFTLPRSEPAPIVKAQAETSNARVLVIDDDPIVHETIAKQLRQGYNVLTLNDSRRAVDLVREANPAVVILDVMMPHQDGWEVLKALKSDPETQNIPVVICSVITEQKLALSLGASDYLVKPVNPQALRRVIERFSPPGGKVLAVDDDLDALEIIRRMLGGLSYQVITALDGPKGLSLAVEQLPDVIVLDLMMPGLSGFEVLAELRENPKTYNLPVVVVTAKDLTSAEREKLQAGAAVLLQKGQFTAEEFNNTVRRAIARNVKGGAHG